MLVRGLAATKNCCTQKRHNEPDHAALEGEAEAKHGATIAFAYERSIAAS